MKQVKLDERTILQIDGNQARVIKDDRPGSLHQFALEQSIDLIEVQKSDPSKVIITYTVGAVPRTIFAEISGDAITFSN